MYNKKVTVWVCRTANKKGDPHEGTPAIFCAASKEQAEYLGAKEYSYETAEECLKDGWIKPAVEVVLPKFMADIVMAKGMIF